MGNILFQLVWMVGIVFPLLGSTPWNAPEYIVPPSGRTIAKVAFNESQNRKYAALAWVEELGSGRVLVRVSRLLPIHQTSEIVWESLQDPFITSLPLPQKISVSISDDGYIALGLFDSKEGLHLATYNGASWSTQTFSDLKVRDLELGIGYLPSSSQLVARFLYTNNSTQLITFVSGGGFGRVSELGSKPAKNVALAFNNQASGYGAWLENSSGTTSLKWVSFVGVDAPSFFPPVSTLQVGSDFGLDLAFVSPTGVLPVFSGGSFLTAGNLLSVLPPYFDLTGLTYFPVKTFQVSGNRNGTASVIWGHPSGISINSFSELSWKPSFNLSSNQLDELPKISVDLEGRALAVWRRGSSELVSRFFDGFSWQQETTVVDGVTSLVPVGAMMFSSTEKIDTSAMAVWLDEGNQALQFTSFSGANLRNLGGTILPPSSISGKKSLAKFSSENSVMNVVYWGKSSDASITGYRIFRDGIFLKQVEGHSNSFEEVVTRGALHKYFVTSVSSSGEESSPLILIL